MASRFRDKARREPRLRGLERRRKDCRRKQARRKSDNNNGPVAAVQQAIAAGNRRVRRVAADKPAVLPGDSGLLRSILQQLPVGIMLCGPDLKITFVNQALEKMLLQREAEIRQQFAGVDPRNLVGTTVERFQKDARCAPLHARIRVDSKLVVELSATAIVNPDGDCMGRMVVWTEVLDRKTTDTEILRLLASIKSTGDEQSRELARLSRTVTRLGESIETNRFPPERGEAKAPLHGVRRNLRAGQPRSRRLLMPRTDE